MKKSFAIGHVLVLAFLLTFVMDITSVFVGMYIGVEGLSLNDLSSNKIVELIELLGEISLPLFLFALYKGKEEELQIVMPFPKENRLLYYVMGYIAGAFLFFIIWLVAVFFGGFQLTNIWSGSNVIWFILFGIGYGVQGMAEEIACRGYLQGKLMQIVSNKSSIIISALFFSFLHILNEGITVLALVCLFLFGIIMGIIRYYTNSLWIVGAFHSAWNFIQGPILEVSVSETESQALIVKSTYIPNKDFINGGNFGLEGSGLSVLTYLVLLTIIVIFIKKKRARL